MKRSKTSNVKIRNLQLKRSLIYEESEYLVTSELSKYLEVSSIKLDQNKLIVKNKKYVEEKTKNKPLIVSKYVYDRV